MERWTRWGPADAVAIGIIVIGLIDAGLLAGAGEGGPRSHPRLRPERRAGRPDPRRRGRLDRERAYERQEGPQANDLGSERKEHRRLGQGAAPQRLFLRSWTSTSLTSAGCLRERRAAQGLHALPFSIFASQSSA